jgi:pyruvate formate lyase activating enzyme
VGLQRLSLKDYPGKLCAKAIVPGCNFRCPYCDKADIVLNHQGMELIPEGEVLRHLYRVRAAASRRCTTASSPSSTGSSPWAA